MRVFRLVLVVVALFGVACTETPVSDDREPTNPQPVWVETVYPEPGATAAVPDAVEVDHSITGPDEDVRLVVDGVDVTTYATFEAGKIRYESGDGPVVFQSGDHWAEVQRVTLPVEGIDFRVLDRFRWEFRVS